MNSEKNRSKEIKKQPNLGVYKDSTGKVYSKLEEIQEMLNWVVGKETPKDIPQNKDKQTTQNNNA